MTIVSNVPPPPRLTGNANTDLAAVTSWAYSMYRVLATDDGGVGDSLDQLKDQIGDLTASGTTLAQTLVTLRTDIDTVAASAIALSGSVDTLSDSVDTRFDATGDALTALADAIDAVTARMDAIAAVTPVPSTYSPNDLKDAINAIISAAAVPP